MPLTGLKLSECASFEQADASDYKSNISHSMRACTHSISQFSIIFTIFRHQISENEMRRCPNIYNSNRPTTNLP